MACLEHAGELISSAELVLKPGGQPHTAYHLAVLALEEIGKADLVAMSYASSRSGEPSAWIAKHAEDHVKKLFWAFWGPSMGKTLITKDQIEAHQGMAKAVHEKRLRSQYVDVGNERVNIPRDAVQMDEGEKLIGLARARLELARLSKPLEMESEELKKDMAWFIRATDDPTIRGTIMGRDSMSKLVELGDAGRWIHWLREQFEAADAEASKLLAQELSKSVAKGNEAQREKWKVGIRLVTNSHVIDPAWIGRWNNKVNWIKLSPVQGRRNCIQAHFIFPKGVPVQGLPILSAEVVRKFVVSLNVGTLGFFWWYVPPEKERLFESVKDLESGRDLDLAWLPNMPTGWSGHKLDEAGLNNTMSCLVALMHRSQDTADMKREYAAGLALMAKSDVHIAFFVEACAHFLAALRHGIAKFGDHRKGASVEEVFVESLLPGLPGGREDLMKYAKVAEQLEVSHEVPGDLNIEVACRLKVLCDGYFNRICRQINSDRASAEERGEK